MQKVVTEGWRKRAGSFFSRMNLPGPGVLLLLLFLLHVLGGNGRRFLGLFDQQ